MKEIWKQYKDSNYEVSNMGQVRNIKTQKIEKPNKKDNREHSYLMVNLYKEGKFERKKVHRLVLETFLGEQPDKEVDHINGIKDDNRLDNLEYVSREENYQRYVNNGGQNQRVAVKGTNLSSGEVLEFKSLWEAGRFLLKNRKKGNVDQYCTNIKSNLRGQTNSAYGYVWEFVL